MSQPKTQLDLDQLSINTIRTLAIDAVQQANSGHPGAPMGLAPVVYALWQKVMNFATKEPSNVLFQLLGFCVDAGKNVISVALLSGVFKVADLTQAQVLRDYAPACVVINDKCRILLFFGATGMYLEASGATLTTAFIP